MRVRCKPTALFQHIIAYAPHHRGTSRRRLISIPGRNTFLETSTPRFARCRAAETSIFETTSEGTTRGLLHVRRNLGPMHDSLRS